MKANYRNNKKHGRCSIYKNRMLIFEGMYKDGERNGLASEYDDNKKRLVKVQYDRGNLDYSCVEYDHKYYIEEESKGNISCYSLMSQDDGSRFEHEGYCYKEKDRDEGEFEFIHKDYDDNTKFDTVVLRQMQGENMKVYSRLPFLSKDGIKYKDICCYDGEYEPSFVDGYPRCGEGNEVFISPSGEGNEVFIDASDDENVIAKLYGRFNCDRCNDNYDYQFLDKNGYCICNCTVTEDRIKHMTIFDEKHEVRYNGCFDDWIPKVNLHIPEGLDLLDFRSIAHLIIDKGFNSDEVNVDFSHLLFVKSIQIGDDCFPNATTVTFFHLPFLQTIEIGNGCFSRTLPAGFNKKNLNLLPEETGYQGILTIHSCPLLRKVIVGDNCFMEFSNICIESCFIFMYSL